MKNKSTIFRVLGGAILTLSALLSFSQVAVFAISENNDVEYISEENQSTTANDEGEMQTKKQLLSATQPVVGDTALPGYTVNNVSIYMGTGSGAFYVYLKTGEQFNFTATFGGNSNKYAAAADGAYHIIQPNGEQLLVNYPNGVTTKPDPIDGTHSIQLTAEQDGIYVVKPVTTRANANADWHDLTFGIYDENNSYQSGRVWSDLLVLTQRAGGGTTGVMATTADYTFYHMTADGYLYKQELLGYNGVHSTLYSDPVGVVDSTDSNCTSVYGDTPQKATTVYNKLQAREDCQERIQPNHLFFEYPSSDLPQEADLITVDDLGAVNYNEEDIVSKKEIFVFPDVHDKRPAFSEVTYKRNKYNTQAGEFYFDVSNHQGFVEFAVTIDYDRDGVVDETINIEVLANSNGTTTVEWDGKNNAGENVPLTAKINSTVEITRRGEVHFMNADTEQRAGVRVQRLIGDKDESSGNGTLWYNANTLPIDVVNSPTCQLPTPMSGSYDSLTNPTFRAWTFVYTSTKNPIGNNCVRTANFYGKPDGYDVSTENGSFGDGNYIDEWTYEQVHIVGNGRVTTEPYIVGLKVVEDTIGARDEQFNSIPNGVVEPGETAKYTIRYYNYGSDIALNAVINDPFQDEKFIGSSVTNLVFEKYDGAGNLVETLAQDDARITLETVNNKPALSIMAGNIDIDGSLAITFDLTTATTMPTGEPLVNQATFAATNMTDKIRTTSTVDADDASKPSMDEVEPKETIIPTGQPKLIGSKTVNDKTNGNGDGIAQANEIISYEIQYTNMSEFEIRNLAITDDLHDENLDYQKVSNVQVEVVHANGEQVAYIVSGAELATLDEHGISMLLPFLSPQDSIHLTFDIQLPATLNDATVIKNMVTAEAPTVPTVKKDATINTPTPQLLPRTGEGFMELLVIGTLLVVGSGLIIIRRIKN